MIMESLVLQSKLFLSGDMGIEVSEVELFTVDSLSLGLKQNTSMIGVGGKLNLMIVISFDNAVLDKLVAVFMDGEAIDEEEEEEVRESVTGEVLNTILGLALPTFPNRGKGVTITPPVTIRDVSSIKKHKNSNIIGANIMTEYGALGIGVIGENIKL
jgi:chemotaxis protein CheX